MKLETTLEGLLFYATAAHRCSYLPGQLATTVVADPAYPKDPWVYTVLSENGFRRSGSQIYRPRCQGCNACIPVRVPVSDFQLRRSQRRTLSTNQDLDVVVKEPAFRHAHYELYARYLSARHAGGGMDNPTPAQYVDFLIAPWADTRFVEFRLGARLVAVAVVDLLVNALSAVYTFYDPDLPRRGLGTYAVLWTIQAARQRGLDWLYLGYLIESCPKMRYKREFQPQEHLRTVPGYGSAHWLRAGVPEAATSGYSSLP